MPPRIFSPEAEALDMEVRLNPTARPGNFLSVLAAMLAELDATENVAPGAAPAASKKPSSSRPRRKAAARGNVRPPKD
jgi:hypothetical protein